MDDNIITPSAPAATSTTVDGITPARPSMASSMMGDVVAPSADATITADVPEASTVSAPVNGPAPAPADGSGAPTISNSMGDNNTPAVAPNPAPTAPKKGKMPVVVIAVVVAVVLALAAYFVYMTTMRHDKKATPMSEASKTTTTPVATVSDIDTANSELDAVITKSDNDKDFAVTDLTDTSLNL